MFLGPSEVGYFIEQVGLSAQSFGVAPDDVTAVGKLLTTTFDTKCAAAATVIPAQGAQLQAICTADDCPAAADANCSAYGSSPGEPANATAAAGSASSSPSAKSGGVVRGGWGAGGVVLAAAVVGAAVLRLVI